MRYLYNYIKTATLAAVVGLGAASCADFLEIEPRDMVTEIGRASCRERVFRAV